MTLQSPEARQARNDSDRDLSEFYCPACEGVMRIVAASPIVSKSARGTRVFVCDYRCDCGYSEVINLCSSTGQPVR